MFDVASGARVDVARVDNRAGADVRPLFDELAAKLLDLSGAPNEVQIGIARSTTASLEAYRAYLAGVEDLNRWDLAGAERELGRAIRIDTTFGLAYYKLALTRGWLVGTGDSIADAAIVRATAYSENLPAHDRTVINAYRAFLAASSPTRGPPTSSSSPATRRRRRLVRPRRGVVPRHHRRDQAPAWTQAIRAFKRTLALDPGYALAYEHVQAMLSGAAAAAASTRWWRPIPSPSPKARPAARVDSVTTVAAVRRARAEALATARSWVNTQPTNLRAHGAMVDAYIASGNYGGGHGRGGPLPADRAGAPGAAVRRGPDPLRLGRGGARRPRPSHRARYGRAAGLPELRGHADGGGRHLRRRQRLRLSGRHRERRQDDRPGRPGATRSDPAAWPREPNAGREGWRRMALGELYGATGVRPRRSAKCGRARPRRCGWRRRTGGPTWRTAAPRRRSGCSPGRRREQRPERVPRATGETLTKGCGHCWP